MERSNITHTKLGQIHQGQYGGCPGRDCTSVTYLEELRRDILILTQSAYTNFDNDAASCYNRILMSVASLSGRKYGVHKKVVYVHAATLREAKYKVKLSSKTSNTSYQHCKQFPFTVQVKDQKIHQWYGVFSQAYYLTVIIQKHMD